jgi:hypothetical protein
MKRGLISKLENGRICDVVEVGSEFETTDDFFWVDIADDVTTSERYDLETKEIIYFDPAAHPGFVQNGYLVARAIAYGSVGEQMDMMFKEIQATGTLSPDGPWATHVAKVKADIPKDDPQAVYAYVKADWERRQAEIAAAEAAATATQQQQ